MGDLREQMNRGRRQAPSPDEALADLTDLRARRTRNGRVLSAAVALAVTGALVVGGVAVLNHRGAPTGPGGVGSKANTGAGTSGSGATTGSAATTGPATSAAGGSSLTAGPGQFYYWKFAVVYDGQPATMTYWWSPEGSGRVVSTSSPNYSAVPDGPLHMGKFPIGDDLSHLSTDPTQLLPELVQRSSDGGASPRPDVTPAAPGQTAETGRLVSAVEDLLSEVAPHASPDLRIALYGVLKGIPTVQDLGSLQDPTGRPAVALRVTIGASVKTFWFDPDTHLFLAEKQAIDPSAGPFLSGDTAPAYVIVQSAGIVDSDTAVPTGDQRIVQEAGPLPTS